MLRFWSSLSRNLVRRVQDQKVFVLIYSFSACIITECRYRHVLLPQRDIITSGVFVSPYLSVYVLLCPLNSVIFTSNL